MPEGLLEEEGRPRPAGSPGDGLLPDELARDRSPAVHAELAEHVLRMAARGVNRDPQ